MLSTTEQHVPTGAPQVKFLPVASFATLPDGKGTAVKIDGREVLLIRSGDTVHALDNLCPHAGARLERGRVAKGSVSCPLHGAKFDLVTGRCRSAHVAGDRGIVTHRTRIVDGEVQIALSDNPVTMPPGRT